MTPAEARRAVFAYLRAPHMDATTWGAVAAVTIGTNLLDFATLPPPGAKPGLAFVLAAVVRVVAVIGVVYALLRRVAGATPLFGEAKTLGRFALLFLLLLVATGAIAGLVTGPLVRDAPLERQWLGQLGVTVAFSLLTIRLLAFQAAVAAGTPFAGLPSVWRGQRGATLAIALAYLAIVVPVMAVHGALTLIGVRLPLEPAALAALALIDGLVQAVQLVLSAALSVTAWRAALRREGLRG